MLDKMYSGHLMKFDGFEVPVHNNQDYYEVDLTDEALLKDRKKRLTSLIVRDVMDIDLKKFPLEKRLEILSDIIGYHADCQPNSFENKKLTQEFVTSYYWLFK
jgi:hypothetical protein